MNTETTTPNHPMIATHFDGGAMKADFVKTFEEVLVSLPPTFNKEGMTEAYKKWVDEHLPFILYNKDGTLRPLKDILRPVIQVPIHQPLSDIN